MATLVHPSSAESTTSQLDLFSVPPNQTSLEKGSFTEYHPVSVLTSTGPIEFTISAENSNYIDLANSFLYVRASVTTVVQPELIWQRMWKLHLNVIFYIHYGHKWMFI